MNEREIEMAMEEAVRDGLVEKLPGGKYRLTEKGTKQVENVILPSVGMTEKMLKSTDDLAEALHRLDNKR